MEDFLHKRFEKFHEDLKSVCRNSVEFDKFVVVDQGHLTEKKKDYLRIAIGNERIASIIMGGLLVPEKCDVSQSGLLKITIAATFKELTWTNFDKNESMTRNGIAIKIAVKETPTGERHVVVTVFRDKSIEDRGLLIPEVGHEIWD